MQQYHNVYLKNLCFFVLTIVSTERYVLIITHYVKGFGNINFPDYCEKGVRNERSEKAPPRR